LSCSTLQYNCVSGYCAMATCKTDADCQRTDAERICNVASGLCTARQCVQASDCCTAVPAGFRCGADYPYIYECAAGHCASAPCSSDAQCASYANSLSSLGLVSRGCIDGTCQLGMPCFYPSDCCTNVPSGYQCNADYPYRYSCDDGFCTNDGCDDDSQCSAMARSIGAAYVGKCVD
jgi:hypothetical protein